MKKYFLCSKPMLIVLAVMCCYFTICKRFLTGEPVVRTFVLLPLAFGFMATAFWCFIRCYKASGDIFASGGFMSLWGGGVTALVMFAFKHLKWVNPEYAEVAHQLFALGMAFCIIGAAILVIWGVIKFHNAQWFYTAVVLAIAAACFVLANGHFVSERWFETVNWISAIAFLVGLFFAAIFVSVKWFNKTWFPFAVTCYVGSILYMILYCFCCNLGLADIDKTIDMFILPTGFAFIGSMIGIFLSPLSEKLAKHK